MQLPILIFSLVVLFWACLSVAEENVNPTQDVIDSVEKFTYSNEDVPWEKSLSRNKRGIIINPVSELLLRGLGKGTVALLKPVLDLCGFAYGILIGKTTCPKIDDLSFVNFLPRALLNPFRAIETVLCYVLDVIGSQGRALVRKGLEVSVKCTKKIIIPGLHTVLNKLKDTGMLPPSINAMIDVFNAFYRIAKLLGYVG